MNIGGKQFMNLQEAVGWLLQNNALPFQCNVNYVADTEIAKTTIINPSPAEIKVGSLVLFADSKMTTVTGITANGFMVGSDYADLKGPQGVSIVSITVDSSGYVISTLSNGTTINSGQIKQISNFSIDASQHLIANYNNGTSTDLGAIFAGNVNIAGNFTANSIIENMSGYGLENAYNPPAEFVRSYAGIVKNGNKLTLVVSGVYTKSSSQSAWVNCFDFKVPSSISSKIVNDTLDGQSVASIYRVEFYKTITSTPIVRNLKIVKDYQQIIGQFTSSASMVNSDFETDVPYKYRIEVTFLLSENLAS